MPHRDITFKISDNVLYSLISQLRYTVNCIFCPALVSEVVVTPSLMSWSIILALTSFSRFLSPLQSGWDLLSELPEKRVGGYIIILV